jgi:ribosomal protein S18 acetylase RimI-like enzyme
MAQDYHGTVILNDGRELVFQWLGPGHRPALEALIQALPAEKRRFLGLNFREAGTYESCLSTDDESFRRLLGAFDSEGGDRLAGYAYLCLGRDAHAHMAEVETVLHPDYHDLGLGSGLLREMISHTSGAGILLLRVEANLDDKQLISALKRLGFEPKAILEDYRLDAEGEPYDVIIMIRRLLFSSDREFLYRY